MMEHTFAICAYQESPYLEECIQSLLNQEIPSNIFLCTSTPNAYIEGLAEKYGIELKVNQRKPNIASDWNFAYAQAETEYVTLAHQDDIYLPSYSRTVMEYFRGNDDALIAFTDYGELRDGVRTDENTNLKIKRILLAPMHSRLLSKTVMMKRGILSLGNPVCCPAVTFHKTKLPACVFTTGFRSNEDWHAWERLSRLKGSFGFIPSIGMYHRIHEGSETSSIIGDNSRTEEDYAMFRKFWPAPAAYILSRVYALSEKSNSLGKED